MTKFKFLVHTTVFAAALVGGCATVKRNSVPQGGWINNMHRLSAAHLYLLPKSASYREFADPAQKQEIAKQLRGMAETATAIANDPKAPNADPMITFTAAAFAADMRQTYADFERGDVQLARFNLNRVGRYCISCHTRADRGIRDFEVGWSSEISGLSSPEKIDFYLANRRYHSAWAEAKAMASNSEAARRDPHGWIRAIKRTMAMIVRVNDSPAQAEELASLTLTNSGAPNHLRREAKSWLIDIREWRADKRRHPGRDLFQVAVNLLEVKPSFIRSLRASGILHEILEDTNSPHYGEALFYSGIAASSLLEFNLGYLDQYYFEACISRSPHSELAEKCYARVEDSVLKSNPLLWLDPERSMAEQARLADLRKLAEVRDPSNDLKFFKREERVDPSPGGK